MSPVCLLLLIISIYLLSCLAHFRSYMVFMTYANSTPSTLVLLGFSQGCRLSAAKRSIYSLHPLERHSQPHAYLCSRSFPGKTPDERWLCVSYTSSRASSIRASRYVAFASRRLSSDLHLSPSSTLPFLLFRFLPYALKMVRTAHISRDARRATRWWILC
jgi:hypothetical protein